MREVAVIGIGQTPIREEWEKSLRLLAGEAVLQALADGGMQRADGIFVGNMIGGSANNQQHLGAYIADWVGLRYTEAVHLETACSSGAAAFRSALIAVASGELESAIAVGAEKMTDSPGSEVTTALATAADADWETDQGLSFVVLNALLMKRYMLEHGWTHKDFAPFSINAHANGVHNPNARFRKAITLETYTKAALIADPINLMDASPMGDGAAAALLVPADSVPRDGRYPIIRVAASAAATDALAVHDRADPLWLTAAEKSARQAYQQASLTPKEIDLFELHDAFSIMACLSLEAAGFAERGQGPRLAIEGEILLGGRIPIATRGGLKARGHPIGATGMYQIVEVVQQLRGDCGETQVKNARIGMSQNIGGSGSNIITHILKAG